jgi:hypothetical protein
VEGSCEFSNELLSSIKLKAFRDQVSGLLQKDTFGRQILAGGSLLRSGQTQVGEPKIGEHAQ